MHLQNLRAKKPSLKSSLLTLLVIITAFSYYARADPSSKYSIYNNGTLSANWTLVSRGVPVLNLASTQLARTGSTASIYAVVQPFGEVILQRNNYSMFNSTSVLDIWLRGSVLTSSVVCLADTTASGRTTAKLSLNPAAPPNNLTLISSADAQGWHHIYLSLKELALTNDAVPRSHSAALWNQIVFQDVSGQGFAFNMDNTVLLPAVSPPRDGTTDITCIGTACSLEIRPEASESDLVPLYGGGDIMIATSQGSGTPMKVLAKLAPGVGGSQVLQLCSELTGVAPPITIASSNDTHSSSSGSEKQMQRFNGDCPGVAVGAEIVATAIMTSTDSIDETYNQFPFFTIVPASADDLYAMRASLNGTIAYFEIDGVMTTIPVDPVVAEYYTDVDASNDNNIATDGNATVAGCSAVPWGLDRIDQKALPLNGQYNPGPLTGAGVHIFIIDTGIYSSSNEFIGRIGQGANCVGGSCNPSGSTADGNGHGSHVAGIAGGTCFGVAKRATLHPVKALGDDGSGDFSGIVDGIRWATGQIQSNGWKGVLSMSLGGSYSQSVNDAVQAAVAAGVPVAVAAGNDNGADACSTSPASAPSAVTVGATDSSDHKASYSNVGRCLDIWAPGTAILSVGTSDPSSTRVLSGTSMATPAVAGAMALLLQPGTFAASTPQQVYNLLNAASVKLNLDSSSTQNFLQSYCAGFCESASSTNGAKCSCG